jgi:hypothetical protein
MFLKKVTLLPSLSTLNPVMNKEAVGLPWL